LTVTRPTNQAGRSLFSRFYKYKMNVHSSGKQEKDLLRRNILTD